MRARAVFLAGMLLLSGMCGCQKTPSKRLYIYNWTYYIPDDVVSAFEREYHVAVVYDMYASNEEMFAKLKAGGGGYDIVFPSGDYVSIMIREGMLEPIDKSKLSNFGFLDTAVLQKIRFDPGCRYCVPYMMGAAGITVNKENVADYERSWSIFNRSDLRGRLTLLDDMREVLGAALRTLGYSVNTIDEGQLRQAKAIVMQWRKNIVKFDAEAFGKGFAAGEFWAVHCYAENVFLELDSTQASAADFFIPREGGCAYMDNMVILKGAKNKDVAYMFMNYILDPSVYARIVDYLKLPSINTATRAQRKVTPRYDLTDLANSELKEDLGEHLERYNEIWQEIRIGR
ncbi:MAG: extracellular solute-binding protein [Chitinispirillaceae bacterium]|nr:extracellular solute-binding protein [Chitinispirillaceae bacterium]